MDTKSVEKLNNNKRLNIFRSYLWFEKTFLNILKLSIQEFWNINSDVKLISISDEDNFFLYGNEYFATRRKLSKTEQFIIRLSKESVQTFLDKTLGEVKNFDFENITELEGKILTAFNNAIYEKFKTVMLSNDNKKEDEGEYNLTFLIKTDKADISKILITLPKAYLQSEEVFPSDERFSLGDFPTTKACVDLYVGKTQLPLSDVQNLEKEDIIVLENSNINNMTLHFCEHDIGFKVSPDPSLIINFDEDNGGDDMTNNTNIWDNIQVDVSAEFEQVKIPLGEIKQISEGQVIDMGSIYDNKVFLKVENKTIASGCLVIINDRYGVRIDEVVDSKQEEPQQVNPQPQQQRPPQQGQPVPQQGGRPMPPQGHPANQQPRPPQQGHPMPPQQGGHPMPPQGHPAQQQMPPQQNAGQPNQNATNGDFDYNDFNVDDENI